MLNVGAGAGSYETPACVLAVEPSAVMIAQRPAGSAEAVRGVAEALPVADGAVDVATGWLTHHHWDNPAQGFAELRRVARRQVVLTWDPEVAAREFWFVRDYLPEVITHEAGLATLGAAVQGLGPGAKVEVVPVPHDCTDGFFAAHWCRPHGYLDSTVRAGISGLALLPPATVARAITRLAADLADDTWHSDYADLLHATEHDFGYRLVIGGP